MAPMISAASRQLCIRCTAFNANASINCVPLISAKPSFGPSLIENKPFLTRSGEGINEPAEPGLHLHPRFLSPAQPGSHHSLYAIIFFAGFLTEHQNNPGLKRALL